jgi:hypothetical protein
LITWLLLFEDFLFHPTEFWFSYLLLQFHLAGICNFVVLFWGMSLIEQSGFPVVKETL